jgi:solute:Na+ symporter, SSS family
MAGGPTEIPEKPHVCSRPATLSNRRGFQYDAALVRSRRATSMLHLVLLVLFSAAQIAIGLFIARRVKGTGDFFVAGRQLGPGLLFSTFLAANIGAGSTVGAAGLAYADGLSAWWWVGSAGLGSIVLALWVGPRIRAIAAAHDLRTLGDFFEWRYDRRVRGALTLLLFIGALSIVAGQLVAMSKLVTVVIGWHGWIGVVVGGVVMTTYSAAGGLKSTAWVNIVQLAVKMLGFIVALPLTLALVGGVSGLHTATATINDGVRDGSYWNFWQGGGSGWIFLAYLGPSFIVSPGLLQKIYGTRDDRAVRLGVGLNAIALLSYAIMPVLLGMCARVLHPGLKDSELALPMLLVHDLPPFVGSLALAALFSAEVSAADASLFMLSTSLSQDLYRRFLNPSASDARVLAVARGATIFSGACAVAIAIVSPSVTSSLRIFYILLSVSFLVPVIAGIYFRRVGAIEALAASASGIAIVIALRLTYGDVFVGGLTPSMWGLVVAAAAALIVVLVRGVPAKAVVKES